jgi:urea transport system substrate-binding protein
MIVSLVVLGVTGWLFYGLPGRIGTEPIKVGILHSLTGTMSISEKSVVDATLLAIEEINAKGGILGRKIEAIVSDGKSDAPTFAKEAERLITQEKVTVVFGCWTSASRKTVKPIFEKYKHLLFYPLQYEGLEQSTNIVYTGAAPNQQIIPAIKWAFDNLGKKFFLVASDYVFPHSANEIIKAQVAALGGHIVGEEYLLLGSKEAKGIVRKIKAARPDVILNTLNGDTNVVFFAELRIAGVTPEGIPTVSFSIGEKELRSMNAKTMAGDYTAWNYFQAIDSSDNQEFVRRFKEKFGADRVLSDPMEAAYIGVHLWAKAARDAGSADPIAVRKAVLDQSFNAPEGIVHVDSETQHLWKTVRIGKIRPDGQFDIVWTSDSPIRPTPYPPYRTKMEWEKFLQDLYQGWGQSWANPG